MVLYENHLPSLRDGNGDGIGDLAGLIASLDYLAGTLGVSAVWVGPCYRSPLLDQGFDITDHKAIDPTFGDLATFDRLLEEAHARGLKVIADYVPNHTSDQHPWFVESRSSRDSPKRDWYVWADAAADERYPNNWLSEVSGSSWEWDERTGQFYLHSHLKEQPDLNWRNPEVRAAQLDVLRFWLDRGVDGFRIDVAHMLMKDPELRDNPPNPDPVLNPYELQPLEFFTQLHTRDRMHPDLHDVLRDMHAVLGEYDGDRVAIGEIEAMDWSEWATFYGERLDELHLPFAFKLIETPWDAVELARVVGELDAALPDGAWPILALGNHDRRRLATRLGRPQARVAAVLLLTLRGVPTIFYGDELGMVDQEVPVGRGRDAFAVNGGVSHDPTRTPMPWNNGRNGGFSTADPDALWLPVCEEYRTINVAAQLGDPGSSLNLYRRLIELRGRSDALRLGDYSEHSSSDAGCFVYARTAAGERKVVALNLTGAAREVQLGERGTIVLSTDREREGSALDGDVLTLRPDEAVVLDATREGPCVQRS
jgi:alpha-glucosidase